MCSRRSPASGRRRCAGGLSTTIVTDRRGTRTATSTTSPTRHWSGPGRSTPGAPTLWRPARLLRGRQRAPDPLASRVYAPRHARGARARHAVCFRRESLLVVVPRLVAALGGDWADTELDLPDGSWTNIFTE